MRQRYWLLLGGALVLAGVACAASTAAPAIFQQRWAHERWEQRRPLHYELSVLWNDSVGLRHHLRAEILDRRVIAAADLDTGQAIDPADLGLDGAFANIDGLFDVLAEQTRPSASLRDQIARYHPLLAGWLNRCVARLPDVRFDANYGYPALIRFHTDPCQDTLAFRNDMRVAVEAFRPLP